MSCTNCETVKGFSLPTNGLAHVTARSGWGRGTAEVFWWEMPTTKRRILYRVTWIRDTPDQKTDLELVDEARRVVQEDRALAVLIQYLDLDQ